MMIFKKAIPRRTFLRGLGASVALPLLDGMVPAFAAPADTKPAVRLGFVYVPNGVIMNKFTPASEGASFDLPPILEPLAPLRDHFLVMSELAQKTGFALPGEPAGDHPRAGATFLTGVHPKRTEGGDLRAGISVDQIAAKELGQHTQLASLELAIETSALVGQASDGYSAAYVNTISWRTPTTPMPMENQPRAVFERLFGDNDSTGAAERLARLRTEGTEDRSILDFVTQDATRFMTKLGPGDKAKVTEYLDAIRDVERRIQRAEEQASREIPVFARPAGIPATFDEHAKLMFDMQVLAYQCDLTRVTSFMMGHEQSNRAYPEIGIPDAHHALTHHQGDAAKIAKVARINTYHTRSFAYFLEKLRSTRDGDASLLDHSLIVYGSGLSDGNQHLHDRLPILLAGGGGGRIKGGRHLRHPQGTPLTNLYLTMLEISGIHMESLGDSNGRLELLPVA
jgi:hypothetical protein